LAIARTGALGATARAISKQLGALKARLAGLRGGVRSPGARNLHRVGEVGRYCGKHRGFAMTAAKRQEAEMEISAPDKFGPRRMLSEKDVLNIVPVGRTTLYRMEKAGRFPRSTYISPNRRVWFQDEIVAWQNAVDEFNPSRGRGKGRRRGASPSPA
jgi:prophage regulatory protein